MVQVIVQGSLGFKGFPKGLGWGLFGVGGAQEHEQKQKNKSTSKCRTKKGARARAGAKSKRGSSTAA